MKTYADLTDTQLIELHRLAHDIVADLQFQVDVKNDTVHVRSGHLETVFRARSGNIVGLCGNEITLIRNLWKIINQCRQWGIEYG